MIPERGPRTAFLRLCVFTSLRLHVSTSLRLYVSTPSRLYVYTSSRLYVFTSSRLYVFTSLRLYVFTSLRQNQIGRTIRPDFVASFCGQLLWAALFAFLFVCNTSIYRAALRAAGGQQCDTPRSKDKKTATTTAHN